MRTTSTTCAACSTRGTSCSTLQRQNPCPLESLLRPAYFVPENVHADRLFRDMQGQKNIIWPSWWMSTGGTAGIVTIEDLLEEIVGNIYDEFDPEEPMPIQQISDGVWRVEGGLRVEELADVLDVDLPEDADYDTVSGMVMSCLPSIPEDGAQFTVETNGLRIRVENVQDRKVDSALVEKLQPEPAAEDERDEGDKAEPLEGPQGQREKRQKGKERRLTCSAPPHLPRRGAVRGRRKQNATTYIAGSGCWWPVCCSVCFSAQGT